MKLDIEQAIKELTAGKSKPLADTGEYDFTKEKAIRDIATRIGAYAESGPTFDPAGKYLCGTCCFRSLPGACTHVSGKISMVVGSCFIWYIGEPINQAVGEKLTQIEAMYSERPKAKGFGCSRCSMGAEAKKPDADGRSSWCDFWGMHVQPKACCFVENGPDLVEAPGE